MIPQLEVQITADTGAAEAGLGRLQKAMSGLDRATEQYQRELNDVRAALAAGLTTQEAASRAVQEAERNYRDATAAAAKYAGATTSFTRKGVGDMKALGTATQTSSHHTANLAAQFNDIGMMMASGQSPFLLAMQQGTQVSQVLNTMGGRTQILKSLASGFMSVVNPVSLLTIGVIAGGAALFQWGMSALSASEDADTLGKKMEEVTEKSRDLAEELRALRLGVSAEELTLMDAIARQSQEVLDAERRLATARGRSKKGARDQLNAERERLAELEKQLATYRGQVREKQTLTKEARALADAERAVWSTSQEVSKEAERLVKEIGMAATRALVLADVDITSPISSAAKEAALLAARLGTSLERAQQIQSMSVVEAMGRNMPGGLGGPSGPGGLLPQDPNAEFPSGGTIVNPSMSTRGSRGGAGGGVRGNPELEALVEGLKTEREIVEEWRQEGLELLSEANEKELEALGGHAEAKLRLEEEYQERLNRIKEMGQKADLQTVLSGGAEILGALGAFNEKALKMSQAFAAAEAFVSTMKGAAKELEKGTFGFATAAAVIAKGLGFVAAIQGVTSSSSGAVSGVGGASGAAAGGAQAQPSVQTQRVDLNIVGGTDRDRLVAREVISVLNSAQRDGFRLDPRLIGV